MVRRGWGRPLVAVVALVATLAACGGGAGERARAPQPVRETKKTTTTVRPTTTVAPTTTTAPATTTTTAAPPVATPVAPKAAADPVGLAEQITTAETALRDPATTPEGVAAAAWLQQVAYRMLGDHPEWDPDVLARIPAELHESVKRNALARREFRGMATKISDTLPPWQIVAPIPAADLRAHYAEAEAMFGVPWQYLAAINLVETGMGRINGLSVAGAQGPMQFMPATWEAFGAGGDVQQPRDADPRRRPLPRPQRHAPRATSKASLFNYNHHNNYVRGVMDYARTRWPRPGRLRRLLQLADLLPHDDGRRAAAGRATRRPSASPSPTTSPPTPSNP